jgi:glycosyltransferase involved in cell wall biosynthesis
MKELSVVIPLFNEQDNVKLIHTQLKVTLDKIGTSYEIIFIDDGSTDNSFSILKELHAQDVNIKVIRLRRNFGKSAALSAGFKEAKGKLVITMDADLQDDPTEIPNFISKISEGYDLVSGWKFQRYDPVSKRISSKAFNRVTALLTGIKIHDFNCGFKAYRREVTQDIKVYGTLHRYIPALAYWKGYRIGEIKVRHRPRKYGKSKYGMRRAMIGFWDLLTTLFLTKYIRRPLHLFGSVGLLVLLAGFIINVYLLVIRLRGQWIGNRPLLILGILLMIIGVQFISTGLMGELITSKYEESESEYSIREKLGE